MKSSSLFGNCILILTILVLSSLCSRSKSFMLKKPFIRVAPQAYDPNNDLIKYYFLFHR